ncbi:hypothetical protein HQ865_01310 [Mucilaginibacter mali]|uniref:ASCH domain-containing protein n=1 Tax=Mucilaginibacter mali TaxID=2740462 RepID=A0A7D4TK21_9SPHI|nr:hypothetical protein [Mucilaginibacter mali]QKJ28453.1 hypothetical protein HQ865_01310 [Mucilaginibacter mali]
MSTKTPRINYSHNWNNKLMCIAHTTIRPRNDEKFIVGRIFDICLDGEVIGEGIIRTIVHFKLYQLNETMAQIDTGYDRQTAIEMMKKVYAGCRYDYDTQDFSLITIRMPDTRVPYCIPTLLKKTDPQACLFPESEGMSRHPSAHEIFEHNQQPA